MNDEYFDALFQHMVEIGPERAAIGRPTSILSEMDAMTSFGKARTAGRLLFGAELLPLAAAGQRVS